MGVGTLSTEARLAASIGNLDALLRLLLILVFTALARVKSIESLRYSAPSEWGKLIGLDRIPEVRTLRSKIKQLTQDNSPQQWNEALCKEWMQMALEHAGILYIDGHVRVYHGQQTKLPRHHVARQRLCLRATTDYWVNAMDGQPFFRVNKAVDPGMIKGIENDTLPQLAKTRPLWVEPKELAADPLLHKLTLICDRESYSPAYFKRMKAQRTACLTYHKYPGEDWPEDEFKHYPVLLPSGQKTELKGRTKKGAHHVQIKDLPEAERFKPLSTQSKHCIDTITMIAYRAETAMANLLRETISRPDKVRSVLRGIYSSEAD